MPDKVALYLLDALVFNMTSEIASETEKRFNRKTDTNDCDM